jgi:hypothetical protein
LEILLGLRREELEILLGLRREELEILLGLGREELEILLGLRREELEILFWPRSSKLLFGIASSGTARVTVRPQEALFLFVLAWYYTSCLFN